MEKIVMNEIFKQLDSTIENDMFIEAKCRRTKHEPLAGTYKPFYLGGHIEESYVINYNNHIGKLDKEYAHYLFEKLEKEGKGTIEKRNNYWTFTFNGFNDIFNPGMFNY